MSRLKPDERRRKMPDPLHSRASPVLCAAVAVGLTAALGGCQTVVPHTAVPIPAAFKAGRGAQKPAALPTQAWINGFGSPELGRLVAGALVDNLDIEVSIQRINQAQSQAVIATAPLFPGLSGSANVSRTQTSGTRSGSSGASFASNSFGLGLNSSYTLDLFARSRYEARAAEENAIALRFDRDAVALATVASVANVYFSLLSAQDRLRIAEDNLRIAERVLSAVRSRVAVGTGTALDVAQQESVVATQRASIPPLRQIVAQNRNTLAILIGRTPESLNVAGGSLDRLRLPAASPGLPSELLLRRPDIARQEASLSSASASVAAARAAFFPSIQLTGSTGFQSAALGTLLGANSFIYSVAAGLTQPIFDGFSLEGQLALQQARASELAATYRKSILQAFLDVENALVAVRENAEYEARQREAVAASRRALDITEQRLREGTIDIVTLFTVQTTLFGNQDTLARVRLGRFQAVVSLFQALGGGWVQARAVPAASVPTHRFDWRLRT